MLSSILTLTAAALVASTPALGRVTAVHFPASAELGQVIPINITVTSYIQNWSDMGVLFGVENADELCGTCVGSGYEYYDLYAPGMGTNGTVFGNHTVAYTIPTNLNASGSYNIVAAVPYVVGASGVTGIRYFNSSIALTANPLGGAD